MSERWGQPYGRNKIVVRAGRKAHRATSTGSYAGRDMLTIKDIRVNGKRRTFTADRLNDFDVLLRRKNMRIYWRAPRKNGPVRVEAYRFGRPVKVALKFNATPPRKRFRRAASV